MTKPWRLRLTIPVIVTITCALFFGRLGCGESPDEQLVNAARNGDLSDVKDALAAGARVNTPAGPLALLQISGQGGTENVKDIVTELLNQGADINAPGPDGGTAFQRALGGIYGPDVLPLFLAHHPDLKLADAQGNGVVAICIQQEKLDLISSLVDAGAPVDTPNNDGVTPLMLVAQGSQYRSYKIAAYTDLAKYLISKRANPLLADKTGKTPAAYALEKNNYELLLLLDTKKQFSAQYDQVKKADQNQRLGSLIEQHQFSKVKFINGPPPENIDTLGLITQLLTAGADPNALYAPEQTTMLGLALGDVRNSMFTPLDPQLIELLLDHGADPSKAFPDGRIPLMVAASNPEVFELLLKKGADPTVKINEESMVIESPGPGQPPQMVKKQLRRHLVNVLAEQGSTDSLKILLNQKPDLEQVDEKGLTPFLSAIAHGNGQTAQLLLDHGANGKAVSADGQTAADLAAAALDIGTLRKFDTAGKYGSLLKEYSPPTNAPVIGDWYLNKDLVLRLNQDGGGSLSLRGPEHALGWKAVENEYEIDLMAPLSPRMPTALFPMKCRLTYDAEKKRLTLQEQAGPPLVLCRADDPNPPDLMAQMRNSPPVQSNGEDQTRAAIASAATSPNPALTLTQPDLTELPQDVYDITGLSWLQIVGTKMTMLPDQLGQFRLLTKVRIASCPITTIQDGFFNLTNLEDLEISTCRLTALSPKFFNLKKLTDLSLYDNRLGSLPEGWEQLPVLKSLILGGNRLKTLPDSLAKAPVLNWISASDNLLSDLPTSWAGMGLNGIDLSKNRFTHVPPVLFQIQGLTYVNLSGNELTEVPAQLDTLVTLQRLDLSRNQLTAIPDLRHTHLIELDLAGNKITSFPPSKDYLPRTLRELNLSGNKISEIPDWIYETNIRSINISGNVLPDVQARAANERLRQAQQSQGHK